MGSICLASEAELPNDSATDAPVIPGNAEQIPIENQPMKQLSLEDFDLIKVIGRGSFGKVMLVRHRVLNQYFAMKILRKDVIEKKNQKVHTQNEREILQAANHPFIVQLHFAFQTLEKLYLVTDFLVGGELFYHLRKSHHFSEERARFYTMELILALEYLHSKDIVYRDLKPENILIGADGHLKITDFGLSRTNLKDGQTAHSLCGTPEYLAPEILLHQGHDKAVDWWSLGALLYEMLCGYPPFYSQDKAQMFHNRLHKPIEFKPWLSEASKDVLSRLLENNPGKRIKVYQLKAHSFFEGVCWEAVYQKQIQPLYVPKLRHELDLQNIDPMFTDEQVVDTPVVNGVKIDNYGGFTYKNQNIYRSAKQSASS